MIKHLWSLLMIIFMMGCHRLKEHAAITLSSAMKPESISKACSAIEQTGDIFQLLALIKQDTRQVMTYLDMSHPMSRITEIEQLVGAIEQNSERVLKLAGDQWNTEAIEHQIHWELSSLDLPSLTRPATIEAADVSAVYFQGKERPDLMENVKVELKSDRLMVTYHKVATALEYCQLNQTLMISLAVTYRGRLGTGSRTFNLYVKLDNT